MTKMLSETVENLKELTLQQRMKRSRMAKRSSTVMKREKTKKRNERKGLSLDRLTKLATQAALRTIKIKLAKGKDIKELGPAEKTRIETRAKKILGSGRGKAIIKRLMKDIKRKRAERRAGGNEQG